MAGRSLAMPSVEGAAINISQIREQARKDLCDALDSRRGKKALVLDPKLSGPLSLIAQTSLLKEHGVENLYYLEREPIDTDCKSIVYLVRPRVELMPLIASQVRGGDLDQRAARPNREHSVFFVPRRTIICEKVLEEEGVYGDITFGEYPLQLIPFEEDVLSMELDGGVRESLVEGDATVHYYVARALQNFQSLFGTIPNVHAKGSAAASVVSIMKRMRREQGQKAPSPVNAEVETLILIDRDVDLVTPMCTQLTYEGLIDEVLRISNGTVEMTTEAGDAGPARTTKTRLNSTDPIFRELRDLNFGRACDKLREKSIAIQQDYKNIKGGRVEDQKVSDIKGFVKTVKDNMAGAGVDLHATIAKNLMDKTMKNYSFMKRLEMERACVEGYSLDQVYDFVEAMIMKQEPVAPTLRMMALISLCNAGIPRKTFDNLRREFLHSYGYEHLASLNHLQQVGFLAQRDHKTHVKQINFPLLRRALKLVVDDLDDNNPTDIAYAYSHSGYAPLSVRFIQQTLKGKFQAMEDMPGKLPGPAVQLSQTIDSYGMPSEGQPNVVVNEGGARKKPVLVFFIGGVTFSEISTLRFISTQEEVNRDIVIGTTKLINGNTLLETLLSDPIRPEAIDKDDP
mmetsp:Transcript_30543/g.58825  ORF Transcript_30543/g.58825 Transcript_30543/m.58825 type:complete len:626 (-) Transcript_30543:289-2166(-)|eukprot:CAMPEP_0114229566 /NCGR_PEP_ID=MMETSP0058-20121206/2983_1 /TAXON_ID=36894 /ORGANISM="Pyramimonas parkeae, CCMP726" /LENGTH=625 /DNA_ID=CAMNT_0001340665 /DNA_START=290 /DNA_END=2167 /DNA_ORIENTATION=-